MSVTTESTLFFTIAGAPWLSTGVPVRMRALLSLPTGCRA
jgi:hypothetical protein